MLAVLKNIWHLYAEVWDMVLIQRLFWTVTGNEYVIVILVY